MFKNKKLKLLFAKKQTKKKQSKTKVKNVDPNKLLYSMVASWNPAGCEIIDDHSVDSNMDYRSFVLNILKDTKIKSTTSICKDDYMVHIRFGKYCCVCLTFQTPQSWANLNSCQQFLEKIEDTYQDEEASTLYDSHGPRQQNTNLIKMMTTYYNFVNAGDKITKLSEQVQELLKGLMDCCEKLINKGPKLNYVLLRAERLKSSSITFQLPSRNRRRKKSKLIIVMVTSATLLAIMIALALL